MKVNQNDFTHVSVKSQLTVKNLLRIVFIRIVGYWIRFGNDFPTVHTRDTGQHSQFLRCRCLDQLCGCCYIFRWLYNLFTVLCLQQRTTMFYLFLWSSYAAGKWSANLWLAWPAASYSYSTTFTFVFNTLLLSFAHTYGLVFKFNTIETARLWLLLLFFLLLLLF